MLRALCLIMKDNIFRFNISHWLQQKGIDTDTPPALTYATGFYGVFEWFLLEIFGNN